MSGTFSLNHINDCLTKNKLNEGSIKSISDEDTCFKENQSDSVHNINKSIDVDGHKEEATNEVNWKTYINTDGDDNFLNKYNLKKKKKNKKISHNNLISGDNCDILNENEIPTDDDKNEINGDYSTNVQNDDSILESENKEMKAALSKVVKVAEHLGLTRNNASDSNQVLYYGVYVPYEPGSVVIKNDDGEDGERLLCFMEKFFYFMVFYYFICPRSSSCVYRQSRGFEGS